MKNKIVSILRLLALSSISVLFIVSCSNKTDEDRDTLGLLVLANDIAAARSGNTTASQASAGITAVNSVITSQASGGTLTMTGFPESNYELASNLAQKHLDVTIGKRPVPHILPTALTTTTGSCTTNSCNATIDGTANCSLGGSFTLTNFIYQATFASGPPFVFNSTFNGPITFNACRVQAMDLMNFPSMTQTTLGGDVAITGTSNMSIDLATSTSIVNSNTNMQSSNLTLNSGATQAMNLNEVANFTQVASSSNLSSSTVGTVTTSTFTMTVVLTGSITRTGTVGSASINGSKTYNGDSFSFDVSCTFDSSIPSATCSIL